MCVWPSHAGGVSDDDSLGGIARRIVRPFGFVLAVFALLFGWPLLIAAVAPDSMSGGVELALALTPLPVVAGVLIAWRGAGSDLPPPGDYTSDSGEIVFLWNRWRPVHSVVRRRRIFGALTAVALVVAATTAVTGNAAVSIGAFAASVLLGGVTVAMHRSTQHAGRGPRLRDRMRPSDGRS